MNLLALIHPIHKEPCMILFEMVKISNWKLIFYFGTLLQHLLVHEYHLCLILINDSVCIVFGFAAIIILLWRPRCFSRIFGTFGNSHMLINDFLYLDTLLLIVVETFSWIHGLFLHLRIIHAAISLLSSHRSDLFHFIRRQRWHVTAMSHRILLVGCGRCEGEAALMQVLRFD